MFPVTTALAFYSIIVLILSLIATYAFKSMAVFNIMSVGGIVLSNILYNKYSSEMTFD
jgi:hypothetical protein